MATPVMMPNVGITVETCVLTEWLKKKGETVAEGEILFRYETDKSTLEQEAPVSGRALAKIIPVVPESMNIEQPVSAYLRAAAAIFSFAARLRTSRSS